MDATFMQRVAEVSALWLEKLTAVTEWEDPIVSMAFTCFCFVGALCFLFLPFSWALCAVGLYAMAPPTWNAVPGSVQNLLNRMPDKSQEYKKLVK